MRRRAIDFEDLATPVVPFDELRFEPETRSYHYCADEPDPVRVTEGKVAARRRP